MFLFEMNTFFFWFGLPFWLCELKLIFYLDFELDSFMMSISVIAATILDTNFIFGPFDHSTASTDLPSMSLTN